MEMHRRDLYPVLVMIYQENFQELLSELSFQS